MRRMLAITCAGVMLLALASCSGGEKETASGSAAGASSSVSSSSSASGSDVGSGVDVSRGEEGAASSQQESQSAELYIGMNGEFQTYPLEVNGEITPEILIQGIAHLTGWNLDVESAVEGNGKVVVSFAETSSLYAGPPEEQEEGFQVLDAGQLDQTILDSVQKTIQEWIGTEDGAAEVYFTAPDGGDLVLEGIGVTISADTPYTGFPTGQDQ